MDRKENRVSLEEVAYRVKDILMQNDGVFKQLNYRPNQIAFSRTTIERIGTEKKNQLWPSCVIWDNPNNEGEYVVISETNGNYLMSAWRDETAPYMNTLMEIMSFERYRSRFEREIAVFDDLPEKMLDLGLFANGINKARDVGINFLEIDEMRENIAHRGHTAEGETIGIKWLDRSKSEFRINVPSERGGGRWDNVRRLYRRLPDVTIDNEEYKMFGRVANATSITKLTDKAYLTQINLANE